MKTLLSLLIQLRYTMEKDSLVNGKIHLIGLYLVVLALFMESQTAVEAVDIVGFSDSSQCSGSGYTFAGIAQQVCCAFGSTGSILIRDLASCQTGAVYRNGGCTTQVGSGNGPNVLCYVGGSFSGGAWFNGCSRTNAMTTSSFIPQNENKATCCTSTVAPNGIIYTKDFAKGAWVLKSDNAKAMLSQLESVHDAEKVNWLKEQGAHLVSGAEVVNLSP
ncbi:hypothetical protein O6H91_02G123800 [Diphasiastrum complanatum]|uniref:Uncharacterized protein n=1 Tax=Diphasiastrum complanatum TaxID=34168 RepID=A0ACC2EK91_DIPCM|nr:hypothetical protein O6H91_02G123800 [Diphasiastrum complanatum]